MIKNKLFFWLIFFLIFFYSKLNSLDKTYYNQIDNFKNLNSDSILIVCSKILDTEGLNDKIYTKAFVNSIYELITSNDYEYILKLYDKFDKKKIELNDTNKAYIYHIIGSYYDIQNNFKKSKEFFLKSIKSSYKIHDTNTIVSNYYNIFHSYLYVYDFHNAFSIIEKMKGLIKNQNALMLYFNMKSILLNSTNKQMESIKNDLQLLKILTNTEINSSDSSQISIQSLIDLYTRIIYNYRIINQRQKVKEYLDSIENVLDKKNIEGFKRKFIINNFEYYEFAHNLNNDGILKLILENFKFFNEELELGKDYTEFINLNILLLKNDINNEYKNLIVKNKQIIDSLDKILDFKELISIDYYYYLAEFNLFMGDKIYYLDNLLTIYNKNKEVDFSDEKSIKKEILPKIYNIYYKNGKFDSAYFYLLEYHNYEENSNKTEYLKAISSLEFELDRDNYEKSIKLKRLENEKSIRERNFLFVVLLLTVILITLIIYYLRKQRILSSNLFLSLEKSNELSTKLEKANYLLQEQNTNILDSINYAESIQKSLLPSEKLINKYFDEYCLFYKPKDIVSGDFYWWTETRDSIYIAVGDCTGHGVPGALISLLGIMALNDAVNQIGLNQLDLILEYIDDFFRIQLKKDDVTLKDGMEIGLIKFSKENKEIQFSNSGMNLFYINNEGKHTISRCKRTIGESKFQYLKFDVNEIKGNNLKLFLYSDGFAHQLNEKSSKIGTKQLNNFLNQNSNDFKNLNKNLIEFFDNHRGNREQLDDLTILGLSLKS